MKRTLSQYNNCLLFFNSFANSTELPLLATPFYGYVGEIDIDGGGEVA